LKATYDLEPRHVAGKFADGRVTDSTRKSVSELYLTYIEKDRAEALVWHALIVVDEDTATGRRNQLTQHGRWPPVTPAASTLRIDGHLTKPLASRCKDGIRDCRSPALTHCSERCEPRERVFAMTTSRLHI
jgi:hypothetical protein